MLTGTLPRALLAAALVFLPLSVGGQVPVPPLKARVTDLTNTLTADQRAALEAKLASFEEKKGSQVAVLLVPTTEPEAIDQYSIRVAEQWKLGRKGVDDGALLLIAKNDRKMRIEVGRGLEGPIPDAIGKRIVSDVIAPRFREGDFYGGITAGVDRILRTIEGEPLPPPTRAKQPGDAVDWSQLLMLGAILAFVVGGVVNRIFGRYVGSGIVGTGTGFVGYMLSGAAAALVIGVIAFLISLLSGSVRRGSSWGPGGGWSSGGWGSGGGWGGGSWSSGGGGFSGGGGDFGGGGASGSW